MKKSFGFTLSEVLITLGIIGVIAALTAPAVIQNTGRSKVGPALARFVNSFETATSALIMDREADNLSDISSSLPALMPSIQSYLLMTSITDTAYKVNGASPGNGQKYRLKDGTLIVLYGSGTSTSGKEGYEGQLDNGYLLVDIDGTNGKNKAGVDVFAFTVDKSGILYPYSESTCNPNSTKISDGLSCTATIVNNNWKADY